MKHVRMLGLTLVAAVALSALAATGASAAELEYRVCVKVAKNAEKKYTGKYSDKACTEINGASEGKYEAQAAPEELAYTGKGKAATITAAGTSVTCKKTVNAGELTTERFGKDQFTFSKCVVTGTKQACETAGAGAGTIKTSLLRTGLVWLDAAETKLGMLFTAVGAPVAAFDCGATSVEIKGRVLAGVENGKKGQTLTLATSGSSQALQNYWFEEEEFGPFTLFTVNGAEEQAEATITLVDEQGPKGVAAA